MPASPTLQTADEVRGRLNELRKDFADLPRESRTDADSDRARNMIAEVHELDAHLTAIAAAERRDNAGLAATMFDGGGAVEHRSGAAQILDSESFRSYAEAGLPRGGRAVVEMRGSIDSLFLETRAPITEFGNTGPGTSVFGGNFDTTYAGSLAPVGQPIAPLPRVAKLYLRDLIPKMPTTLAQVPYIRELNPTANEAASAVAEGTAKPNATIAFQGAKADPTVIAATLVLSKQLFADAPLVAAYIRQRLPYMVKFQEDYEFLNGSGNWPDVQGIFNTPGVQSQAATTGDPALSIGNAFADIENSDGSPTGVVMNPKDAWTMFTRRTSGSGQLDAGTPFSALPLTVWGVPTYRTRAKAAGSALVADFVRGAAIIDREQVNVQMYQERYAELNEVLVLCEERVGLAVFRPDLFVDTAL